MKPLLVYDCEIVRAIPDRKAEQTQDTETAYLLLDEARSITADVPSDRLDEAKALVAAVSEKLAARA